MINNLGYVFYTVKSSVHWQIRRKDSSLAFFSFVLGSLQADLFGPWEGGCERTHRTPPAWLRACKVCDRHGKNLRTETDNPSLTRCYDKSLTRCYGVRKMSHVVASTLSLLSRGVMLNKIPKRFWLQFYWFNMMSLLRCRFHIVAQEPSDKLQNIVPLDVSIDAQKAYL